MDFGGGSLGGVVFVVMRTKKYVAYLVPANPSRRMSKKHQYTFLLIHVKHHLDLRQSTPQNTTNKQKMQ